MHAARIAKSDRLRRVLTFLKSMRRQKVDPSTMDIITGATVVAVSAIVSELRANGHDIVCYRHRNIWYYKLVK